MSDTEKGETDTSPNCSSHEETESSAAMAGFLKGLQSSLTELVKASKAQTDAFNNLREDIYLQSDTNDDDESVADSRTNNSLDLLEATNQLLDSSNGQSPKSPSETSPPDTGAKDDFLESLTQALLPNSKKSPDIEGKIATLVDNILTGELSQDSVKERGEKYPPPANCKYLTTTVVNEEIWDLLSRKNRSVDLAFQRVQEPLIQGLSSLTILADRLVKDIQSAKTVNARETLTHVMDSIALLGHANWKLNMKRREIIKPDLNPPYTRLCKEEIKPTTKLFGDDLSKHLKEMSEVKRAGQQMQKAANGSAYTAKTLSHRGPRSKPYDRPQNNRFNTFKRRPFLGHGRASSQTKATNQKQPHKAQ